jgi:hypothetical protein
MPLLRVGRHVRLPNGDKLVVARDALEGSALESLARDDDRLLLPRFGGPAVLLQGESVPEAVGTLLRYSKRTGTGEPIVDIRYRGTVQSVPLSAADLAGAGL